MDGNILYGVIAGVLGTAVITLLLYAVKIGGHRLDIPFLLGSRVTDINKRPKVYATGFILHFLAGAAWGAMYILTLTAMGVPPNWPAGILWGFAHGIFVGVVMSTMADTHPYIGKGKPIADPGMLGHRWSELMPYWILGVHIIFGVSMLLIYRWLLNF